MDRPCPREPVGISTPGVQPESGWPCSDTAELAQGQKLFPGEIPQAGQDGIIGRGPVPLGQDKPVPVDPARVIGLGAHLAKKERHQDIGGRQ